MSIMVKIQLLECSRSGFQTVLRVEIDLWPVIDDIHQKGLKRLHIFFDVHLQLAFLLNLSLQAHSWVKTRGLRCMPLQFMHLHETLPTKHSGSRITLLLKVHNDYYYVKPIMAPHSDSVQQESLCMWEKVSKWVLVPAGSLQLTDMTAYWALRTMTNQKRGKKTSAILRAVSWSLRRGHASSFFKCTCSFDFSTGRKQLASAATWWWSMSVNSPAPAIQDTSLRNIIALENT